MEVLLQLSSSLHRPANRCDFLLRECHTFSDPSRLTCSFAELTLVLMRNVLQGKISRHSMVRLNRSKRLCLFPLVDPLCPGYLDVGRRSRERCRVKGWTWSGSNQRFYARSENWFVMSVRKSHALRTFQLEDEWMLCHKQD